MKGLAAIAIALALIAVVGATFPQVLFGAVFGGLLIVAAGLFWAWLGFRAITKGRIE